MASHNVSWVPDVHVCFGDLDFIAMTEGRLVQAPAAGQPLHFSSLNVSAKALEQLQLHTLEARTPRSNQLLDFDYGRLER